MRKPHVWLFDLDDTLMWNSTTYNQPMVDFIQFLTIIFNNRIPYIGSISRFQEDTDFGLANELNPRTGKPYQFSRDRFPDSFVRTYEWLCNNGFGEYSEAAALQCREIGMRAFDQTNYRKLGFVPGGEELLDFLQRHHHPLVLVTKGDEWVQQKKISALNLEQWFSEIHVVPEKTCEVYQGVLDRLNQSNRSKVASGWEGTLQPSQVVMVGNSFSSDIGPALGVGMNGIFIPCSTWKGESINPGSLPEDAMSRLVTFKEIQEVIPWYHSLK